MLQDKLSKHLNSSIYALRSLSLFASKEVVGMAYFGVFEARLSYDLSMWGYCTYNMFLRRFALQKESLRIEEKRGIVWDLGHRDHCGEHFQVGS